MNETRILYAINRCLKDGHCYDREAVQEAIKRNYIQYIEWPAGHYRITAAGEMFRDEVFEKNASYGE